MKRRISLIFVLCMLLSLAACGRENVPELIEPKDFTPAYYTIKRGDIYTSVFKHGSITPKSYTVYFEESGYYKNKGYRIGDMVKAGDVIIGLSGDYEERITELERSIEQYKTINEIYVKRHQSEIKEMKSRLNSMTGFEKDKYALDVRQKETDNAFSEADRENTLQSMEAELANLIEKKTYTELAAPVDGRLAYVSITDEGYVDTDDKNADAPAFIIADENDNYVSFDYQTYAEYTNCDKVKLLIGSECYENPEYIQYTEDELEVASRYRHPLTSRLRVDNPGSAYKMGKYAAIVEYPIYLENVIYAPNDSIRRDKEDGSSYVLKLNENGEEIPTTVEIGSVCENFTEIVSGLSEGDVINCGYDQSVYGVTYEIKTVELSDYSYELQISDVSKEGKQGYEVTSPVGGKISKILLPNYNNVKVEPDTPLLSIIPDFSKSDVEQAKLDYQNQLRDHDKAIADYEEQISSREKIIKNSTDNVEKTIAKYELDRLVEEKDEFIASQDEALAEKKKISDAYESWEAGEECIVYAGYDGTFVNSIPFVVDAEITSLKTLGYVMQLDSFVLNIGDSFFGDDGVIRYGSELSVRSEGTYFDFVAYATRNLDVDTYDNFLKKAVANSVNTDDYIKINSNTSSLNYRFIEVGNIVKIPASCIRTDENEKTQTVLVKSGDSFIEREVKTVLSAGEYVWVYSGLSEGDEYAVSK